MKPHNEILKSITKGDIILIAALLLLSLCLFVFSFSSESDSLRAEIYSDGVKVHDIALKDITESYILTENSCQILIDKDGVAFIDSDCKDKLCIKKGKLKRQGDTMACVPERVVVIIKSDGKEQIDGVAY